MTSEEAAEEISRLTRELERHNRLYYVEGISEIPDNEYDEMFRNLELLEARFPELASANSPTRRVGGEPIDGFEQRAHDVPMLSIDDVFSEEELGEFFARLQKNLNAEIIPVTIEPKIDGVAVALHYDAGELAFAVTRGDGAVGDLVTENVRTIRNIPLRLGDDAPAWLEVRGEIFMPNEKFAEMNESREAAGLSTFKNPRNATAGSLKLLDSREVARRPLDFVAHGRGRIDGVEPRSVKEFHQLLKRYGLPPNQPIWEAETLEQVVTAVRELDVARHSLPYATDGAVIKVNDVADQEQLGYTSRAPRWAAAFKYPPEQKETVLHDITVQVGRTGNLTPVAELEPVLVSGTTVRRATLHNQDEIDRKDVRIGDTVIIEKAGEIIPAVVKVVFEKRPEDSVPFNLFEAVGGICPSCGEPVERPEGFVALKCLNRTCPAQSANQIKQFVSRKALDIDGVGSIVAEKLVERGVVKTIPDLFVLNPESLAGLNLGTEEEPRMLGAKNAVKIVETAKRARTAPLHRWLYGLGIPQVGESAARELARLHRNFGELLESPVFPELSQMKVGQRKEDNPALVEYQIAVEVGPTVANSMMTFLQSSSGIVLLERLAEMGIDPQSENYAPIPPSAEEAGGGCAGKTFVITGTLSAPRNDFKDRILSLGGKVSGSISSKTDYLLAGEGGGSKRDKAESLGVIILSEEDFQSLVGGESTEEGEGEVEQALLL
ncbi:MAG: NAD-dependent DNA ligase LigA [Verrucomicrobiales bacterium]|nr:NAD-dependent DNA ligase LigA [Verrucomicrobiales bacterium]